MLMTAAPAIPGRPEFVFLMKSERVVSVKPTVITKAINRPIIIPINNPPISLNAVFILMKH